MSNIGRLDEIEMKKFNRKEDQPCPRRKQHYLMNTFRYQSERRKFDSID